MADVDDILEKYDLKFEDLDSEELEVYKSWQKALEGNTLTLEDVRHYVNQLRDSVSAKLAESVVSKKLIKFWLFSITVKSGGDQDDYLKARLKNLMLLDAMLSSPERAKRMIEKQISAMRASKEEIKPVTE